MTPLNAPRHVLSSPESRPWRGCPGTQFLFKTYTWTHFRFSKANIEAKGGYDLTGSHRLLTGSRSMLEWSATMNLFLSTLASRESSRSSAFGCCYWYRRKREVLIRLSTCTKTSVQPRVALIYGRTRRQTAILLVELVCNRTSDCWENHEQMASESAVATSQEVSWSIQSQQKHIAQCVHFRAHDFFTLNAHILCLPTEVGMLSATNFFF